MMQLTKLELFTISILQGMAANPNIHPSQNLDPDYAIRLAKETIRQLECQDQMSVPDNGRKEVDEELDRIFDEVEKM